MQRMIPTADPIPACRNGHTPRHIHDTRSIAAGGGHLVECACCATARHSDFDDAMEDWCRSHGRPNPRRGAQRALPFNNVTQLRARL